jgi:hypothetical protein
MKNGGVGMKNGSGRGGGMKSGDSAENKQKTIYIHSE